MNPYAPPQAALHRPLPHAQLKYFFLGLCLFPFAFAALLVFSIELVPLIGFAAMAAGVGATIAWLLWVHRTWSLLPERSREGTSPAGAVVRCLVPLYSVWWTFVLHHRIAVALHEKLSTRRTRKRSPMTLAWLAPAAPLAFLLFVLFVGFTSPVSADGTTRHFRAAMPVIAILELAWPILMFAFMARVDGCNHELARLRAEKKARKAA
jgi:hypothetical protein